MVNFSSILDSSLSVQITVSGALSAWAQPGVVCLVQGGTTYQKRGCLIVTIDQLPWRHVRRGLLFYVHSMHGES